MAGQSDRPSRRTAVMVVVAVVALVAAVFLVRLTLATPNTAGRDAPSAGSRRPAVPAGASGPAGESSGVPVGFAADRRGAVAAAVAYSTASQRWLYFTDDEIKAAIAEIATPIAAPRMAEDVIADVSMARDQLAQSSGRIWWLVRPLAGAPRASATRKPAPRCGPPRSCPPPVWLHRSRSS